jgi:hypothetical protein
VASLRRAGIGLRLLFCGALVGAFSSQQAEAQEAQCYNACVFWWERNCGNPACNVGCSYSETQGCRWWCDVCS